MKKNCQSKKAPPKKAMARKAAAKTKAKAAPKGMSMQSAGLFGGAPAKGKLPY